MIPECPTNKPHRFKTHYSHLHRYIKSRSSHSRPRHQYHTKQTSCHHLLHRSTSKASLHNLPNAPLSSLFHPSIFPPSLQPVISFPLLAAPLPSSTIPSHPTTLPTLFSTFPNIGFCVPNPDPCPLASAFSFAARISSMAACLSAAPASCMGVEVNEPIVSWEQG